MLHATAKRPTLTAEGHPGGEPGDSPGKHLAAQARFSEIGTAYPCSRGIGIGIDIAIAIGIAMATPMTERASRDRRGTRPNKTMSPN
jgi:hypothetical protein